MKDFHQLNQLEYLQDSTYIMWKHLNNRGSVKMSGNQMGADLHDVKVKPLC